MPTTTKPKPQHCHDCEHGKDAGPFKIFCEAGEGMQGDMYASGMLTNGRCVKNRPAAEEGD